LLPFARCRAENVYPKKIFQEKAKALWVKKPTKPGEGAVKKNHLKKSPLRRLARSS
jgi:hypothetical protein